MSVAWHADSVRTRHACISGRCAIQYSPIESSTCTVLPYSCGSKCQLVYACLVRGYGNVYWKGVSKHEKALTRVDLFMGSKQQVAPTGEPPLRGPRLTTVRQAGRRRAAPLLVCGFYVPSRCDRDGSDRMDQRNMRDDDHWSEVCSQEPAWPRQLSIHRAAYYWFHSRRRSKARSIASQFPMPAPSLGELDQPS